MQSFGLFPIIKTKHQHIIQIMKASLHPIAAMLMAGFTFTACMNEDEEAKDITVRETITVLSETRITFPYLGENRYFPIEQLVVIDSKGAESSLGLNAISEFDWERGYSYELSVDKTILANPPMDDTDKRYRLRKILEKRKDPSFNPSDKAVETEADIIFASGTPAEVYMADRDRFTIDNSGLITPEEQNVLTQQAFDGNINLVYILGSDSPLFGRWNYIIDRIYVSSPFSEKLRPLEYQRYFQSPALTEIITSTEKERMAAEGESGDTYTYTLYLYSAENLAIQAIKLNFEKL